MVSLESVWRPGNEQGDPAATLEKSGPGRHATDTAALDWAGGPCWEGAGSQLAQPLEGLWP